MEYSNVATVSACTYYSIFFGIPIPFHDMSDSPRWVLTSLDDFSCNSTTWLTYEFILTSHTPWPFHWI